MCTTSACDLEEIPLDDDDPNSIEFKILAFYVKQHVFKNTSTVISPKPLRTRSLSQKVVASCSENDSWTQVPWPCRNSKSSEKTINLAKKKSSWRTLFGVIEKGEDAQSSPTEVYAQGRGVAEYQGPRSRQSSRSLSNVEQSSENEGKLLRIPSVPQPNLSLLCVHVHLLPASNVALGRHSLCLSLPTYKNSIIIALHFSRLSRKEEDGSEV